jgi:hypothetical protein
VYANKSYTQIINDLLVLKKYCDHVYTQFNELN